MTNEIDLSPLAILSIFRIMKEKKPDEKPSALFLAYIDQYLGGDEEVDLFLSLNRCL